MRIGLLLNCIGLSALIFALGANPTTQPAAAPDLTPRQQDLLLQLSDAEANIQAINKALKVTGYSVGVAYDKIDSNLKGNELMNRQGGGPVRWDEFYGKTANDFPRTGFWDDRMDDHRPQQFKFVYKANNDQIAAARDQISSLLQNQQALLDRRRVHEEDQSRLWATLAWEQVEDREIEFRPLYRFALQPPGPEAAVLRPVILFLRTAASVAHDGLDSIQGSQGAAFISDARRMDAAYTALQQSLADAQDAATLRSDHANDAQTLKSLCKELAEQTKVIADDYSNALDRDRAKEDNSKLEFRGQLQSSLSSFATEFSKLDDAVTQTAKSWGVTPNKGTPTPDAVVAAAAITPAAEVPAQQSPAPPAPAEQFPVQPAPVQPAETAAVVKVKYASGDAEFDTLKNGVKFFKDRPDPLPSVPAELAGLTFARRSVKSKGTAVIDCPAGSTVYAMVDIGTDAQLARGDHMNFDQTMTDSGWTRLQDMPRFANKYHNFVIYKMAPSQPKHLVISEIKDDHTSIHSGGVTIASANLQQGS